MATKIRLARGGSKKRPYYHVVIADVRSPRDGRFIEKIGHWNPMLAAGSEDRVSVDLDRAKYWLEHGATPTDRVARFLAEAGLMERAERSNPNKAKPGKKSLERVAEKAAKAEEAAAAAAEAAAAPAPAEEAPVEETAAAEAPAEETTV